MDKKVRKAGFTEQILDTGEISLNFVAGPDNGPPLVLIPGQGLLWESYRKSLPLLAEHFQAYAVDVRGHGRSSYTPGDYNFKNMGSDIAALLEKVVKRKAFISGNSSGGLIALWVAANHPELVSGIILEDTPVFSAEWPRLRDDCWAYNSFKRITETIGAHGKKGLPDFFKTIEVPVEGKEKVLKFPSSIGGTIAWIVRMNQLLKPGKPVDIPFLPSEVRLIVKCLSDYDPEFSGAFVDGSACIDFDHTEALKKVQCPMLVLHANWFRTPEYGLVGSMDNEDIARLKSLIPGCTYKKITSGHMIHFEEPEEYVRTVRDFIENTI